MGRRNTEYRHKAKPAGFSGNVMTPFNLLSNAFILTLLFVYSCTSTGDKPTSDNTVKSTKVVQIDTSLNGFYVGLEEMCYTDSTGKKDCYGDPTHLIWKWYHLGHLKLKMDSVFLDQSPISIHKGDTTFSASDGAFYYYSGTFQKTDTIILFNLKELFCDYCGVAVRTKPYGTQEVIKRTKQLKGRFTDKGFIVNGYLYARTTKEESLLSGHPALY